MPYANRNDSRWSHKRLRCEPLEHRLMLNADPLGSDVLLRDSSDAVLFAEVTGASYEEFTTSEQDSTALARFASAEELQQYLIEDALERYSGLFGQPGHYWRYWPTYLDGGMVFTTGQAETDPDHSDTNTQVAGVDEGDIVETDGNYLYVLSGQELVIIKAWSGGEPELEIASRVTIDGQPFAEYLNGDRLTVLSREFNYYPMIEPAFAPQIWPPYDPPSPCLTVSVFDVSNRKEPVLVQETDLDGDLVDSRAIGNSVYLVLRDDFSLPPPRLVPVSEEVPAEDGSKEYPDDTSLVIGLWCPPPEGKYVYETKEEYLGWIDGQVLELALPHFSSYGPEGELVESGLLSEATDVYKPLSPDDTSLMSVVVYNTAGDNPGVVSSTSVPTDPASEVYMSLDSLYLLQSGWSSNGKETSILKFDLGATGVDWSAIGTVPGRLLNQFSVDEYNGYLRIATTEGRAGRWTGSGDSENAVFVLAENGQELEIVGAVAGMPPGEKIYSARFLGDRAFVVTYRKVDPLFAIDLSDPTAPELKGELKIPGFSNYLHPVDDHFLFGLGRDADVDTGLFQDPQVSLFDIGDLTDPKRLDLFKIETGRTGGMNIFDDHHAIAYFPEHHVLAVSIPDCGYDEQFWRYRYQNDLWVFKIDVGIDANTGARYGDIELLGRVEHDTSLRRSVRIEDFLYSISDGAVTVHDIFDPETLVARLIYGAEPLGTIDSLRLDNLDLSAGEHWYQFQTKRQGLMALETIGAEAVAVELYNGSGEHLEPPPGQRLEWHVDPGETYFFSVRGAGDEDLLPDDSATVTLSVVPSEARIVGQHLFYNNSTFDGNNPDANTGDDGAIAPDKKALLPGEQATFANYTNFSCGITGMMVDVGNPGGTITLDDFRFRVGNDNDLGTWVEAPAPRTFTVRQHAGTTGSHRVTMAWDDHAIENRWLQVTALAANLGLPEDYVFYFGSAVAESGNSSSDAQVTTADLLLAHKNPRDASNPAGIESRFDYNRDQRVNRTDVLLARNHQTNFLNALKLISPPGAASEGLGAEIDKVSAYDAVLAEAAGGESQSRETSPAQMQWLSELDGTSTLSQPSENQKIAAKTVDELLATLLV